MLTIETPALVEKTMTFENIAHIRDSVEFGIVKSNDGTLYATQIFNPVVNDIGDIISGDVIASIDPLAQTTSTIGQKGFVVKMGDLRAAAVYSFTGGATSTTFDYMKTYPNGAPTSNI